LKSRTAKGAVHSKMANKRPKRAPVPAKQRTFRSSTQARVKESQHTRKLKTEKMKKMAAARPVKRQDVKRLTQEELLVQAAHTEVENRRSLELMLRMEDDRKKLTGPKAPYVGKLIRYTSKLGQTNIMTFEQFDELPKEINSIAPPPPKVELCVITGMRAKYRDPKTGKPYATLDAFKQIRAAAEAREAMN
jgi:vacuolar protein sorting-associated protein 72